MRNFDYSHLKNRTWDNEILSYVAKIHEFKGKQELYFRQKPVELERLVEIAKVQSTESSNRIEGIVTTRFRLQQLVEDKTTPRNRDEKEILGYRNVLNLIHENYQYIPLKSNYILQLHRDLLQYTELSYGGKYKTSPNEIDAVLPNGEKNILFKPLESYETPDAIEQICSSYQQALDCEIVDSLILIPCVILDFLCVHPFNDGNGRMSRLLTLLLLYRNDYVVGKYISIEKEIANTKEAYYQALAQADLGWHEGTNDPEPFIKYMLGIILKCYREFDERLTISEKSGKRSNSYDIVKTYVNSTIGTFTKRDAMENCPSLGSSSVESALKKLVEDGTIIRKGQGRASHYIRKDAIE
uniref:Fic family protein n=1 Tax=Holdemanella biformis TaxID=1735 RepID=UPI00265E3E4E|nr:Fic family protein [Holdemanella biformis]